MPDASRAGPEHSMTYSGRHLFSGEIVVMTGGRIVEHASTRSALWSPHREFTPKLLYATLRLVGQAPSSPPAERGATQLHPSAISGV
jgi:ABC-type dipeptide/oligopeptide/nickel transport system ATPase component